MTRLSNEDVYKTFGRLALPFLEDARVLFASKRLKCSSEAGLWSELVYCILAGTQVPMETAASAVSALETQLQDQFAPSSLAALPGTDATALIANVLKTSGYRYHTTKAQTIVRAASFVQTVADGSLKEFIAHSSVSSAEEAMRRHVPGIGKKIANHWLRNAGMDTCTIDVHLKRLFFEYGLYSRDPEAHTPDKDFERLVDVVRHLSRVLDLPMAETQFALWLAARMRSTSEKD